MARKLQLYMGMKTQTKGQMIERINELSTEAELLEKEINFRLRRGEDMTGKRTKLAAIRTEYRNIAGSIF